MVKELTKFESEVLEHLLRGDHSSLKTLRTQLDNASVTRELTGAGFYLNFSIADHCQAITESSCRIGDVTAKVEGLEYGAGFVLFIAGGKLTTLEGYSFEEPWPDKIGEFSLSYNTDQRKLPF